MYQQFNMTCK